MKKIIYFIFLYIISFQSYSYAATGTGNAEDLAYTIGDMAPTYGLTSQVRGMDEIDTDELTNVRRLLICCSTWGDGDQPDNAQELFDAISELNIGSLTGISYGVLAIGDSAFDLFCESGKEWDMVLEQKGANRAVERIDCDTDYDDYADEWMSMALDVMKTIE